MFGKAVEPSSTNRRQENIIKYRNAFTMIELIFVIVILGILASIAIPKLSATRDDAVIAVCMQNTKTALQDLINFSSAKGAVPTANDSFTNTDFHEDNTTIVSLTYGGGNARFAAYSYYCGRDRDITQKPSLDLFVLQLSRAGYVSFSMGSTDYQNVPFKAGEIKVFVIDTNSSYPIDRLLHQRLRQSGMEGTPYETDSGLKIVY